MRGSERSFRKALREAFEDALCRVKQREESLHGDPETKQDLFRMKHPNDQIWDMGREDTDPELDGLDDEEEGSVTIDLEIDPEQMQLGSIGLDNSEGPEEGSEEPGLSDEEELDFGNDAELEMGLGDDEGSQELDLGDEEEGPEELDLGDEEDSEEEDEEAADLDDSDDEDSEEDEETEDESASRERQQASGYLGAVDGEPEYGDDKTSKSEDGVEEEGVTQSKRQLHGYDNEEPTDYKDLPGEGRGKLGEGVELDEEDSLEQNKMLDMFKSLLQSFNPQQKQALKNELPRMMASSGKPMNQSTTSMQPKESPIPKLGQVGQDVSDDPRGKPVTRSSQQSHALKTGKVEDPNKLGEARRSALKKKSRR